jgi:ABC-2 type transport system permease protein
MKTEIANTETGASTGEDSALHPSSFILHPFFLAVWTLCWRELVRFYRQRNRVIGALGSPLVFWLLIGSGLSGVGSSFRPHAAHEGMTAIEYLYPGTMALVLLFTAIFSTISIIEDRREGFLQAVLVAPISRMSLVAGKILGGTLLAVSQGVIFLLLAPLAGIWPQPVALMETLVVMFAVSFGLTGLGFCIAWRMDSTQGFHAILNLFLIPMWLLSGALFPASGAPVWLRGVMAVNPLTYGVDALRHGLYVGRPGFEGGPPLWVSLGVVVFFALFMLGLATWLARVQERGAR